MSRDPLLDELTAGPPLAERLDVACRATGVHGAALIILSPQERWSACWGTDERGLEFGLSTSAPAACVSRPLLAALLAGLMRRRGVSVDEEIAPHLNHSGVRNNAFFDGISIRHLLSQTDGMGYRPLETLPLDERGCIDVAGLCAILSAEPRELPPGRVYSSSQGGYALLGALIEQWCEQPLAHALYEQLLNPLALAAENRAAAVPPERVCPTTGAGLRLSAGELAAFLEFQQSAIYRPPLFGGMDLSFLLEQQVEYLGWSAGMTGSCLGWKSFAGGWIGQNGSGPDYTMLIRLHPKRNTAMAFVCRGVLPLAYATLARIFGTHMIEFSPPDGPRPLSPEECLALRAPRYTGTFGNRLHRIEIFRGVTDGLEVRITQRRLSGVRALGSGKLIPATRDIFFIPPPNTFGIWFVQHVSAPDTGLDALWDGWHVWPRLTEDIQGSAPV